MAGSPNQAKSGARRRKAASRKASRAPKRSSASSKASKRSPSRSRAREPRPREYAKEAISEWTNAARHGAAAVTALARGATGGDEKPRLLARLNPAKTEKGGRVGDVADKLLSKVGTGGKLASMVSAGSRIVERMRDQGGSGSEVGQERGREAPAAATNGSGGDLPIPLQEAIDIAVPIEVVYALFTRFEDYPEFIDRIYAAEHVDETHATFEARVHGRQQHIEVEIRDARENERVDWRASEGIPHGGVVSFHRLAPRLTHVEVSVDLESEGLLQRLMRKVHLSERAVRADLHRFKAYAELSEEGLGLEEELAEEDFEDEDLGAEDVEQGEWDEEDLDEDDEHATQEGRT